MALSYYEQLTHPFWIKKRDEILIRDNKTCRICDCNTKVVQVHHLCYFPDTHLWEYDDELMVTVCRQHHEQLTYDLPKISGLIAFEALKGNIDLCELTTVLKSLKNIKAA